MAITRVDDGFILSCLFDLKKEYKNFTVIFSNLQIIIY
jgi:hypothetical protein